MNDRDPSSAHEIAAVELRFRRARRKYLPIIYTVNSWIDLVLEAELKEITTVNRHAFITHLVSREYERGVGLCLCYGYRENHIIAEVYANGTVKINSRTESDQRIFNWRFAEPHEL